VEVVAEGIDGAAGQPVDGPGQGRLAIGVEELEIVKVIYR